MEKANKTNQEQTTSFISKHGKLFLWVLSIFSIMFCTMLILANREFRHSQRNIIQSYSDHLQKADSLYFNIANYNKEYISAFLDANYRVHLDSLITQMVSINSKSIRVKTNTIPNLNSSYMESIRQIHKSYEGKLQRDSLLLITERQLLESQTNSMLNLHLNKIEHEYSNITIWAAVLTILFLVFSFYSIFKMDELVQQGNEGLKDIRRLKEKGDEKIDSITLQGENLLKGTKSKLKSFINGQQQIVAETMKGTNDIKSQYEGLISQIYTSLDIANKSQEESIQSLKDQLSMIDKEYEDKVLIKIHLIDSYLETIQLFMQENGISYNKEGGDHK